MVLQHCLVTSQPPQSRARRRGLAAVCGWSWGQQYCTLGCACSVCRNYLPGTEKIWFARACGRQAQLCLGLGSIDMTSCAGLMAGLRGLLPQQAHLRLGARRQQVLGSEALHVRCAAGVQLRGERHGKAIIHCPAASSIVSLMLRQVSSQLPACCQSLTCSLSQQERTRWLAAIRQAASTCSGSWC